MIRRTESLLKWVPWFRKNRPYGCSSTVKKRNITRERASVSNGGSGTIASGTLMCQLACRQCAKSRRSPRTNRPNRLRGGHGSNLRPLGPDANGEEARFPLGRLFTPCKQALYVCFLHGDFYTFQRITLPNSATDNVIEFAIFQFSIPLPIQWLSQFLVNVTDARSVLNWRQISMR